MLIISGKHLRKRYIYPNNTINIYSGSTCIWPYITDIITGAWLISLSASTNTVANTGGTIILTHSVQRTITSVWVHYEGASSELHKDYKTETAVASLSTTIGTINGNILTIPNNPDLTTRNIVVTANYAGVSKLITITQAASDPIYVMQYLSSDNRTQMTFPGGATNIAGDGWICCYSTKNGVKQAVTATSDSSWLTVSPMNDITYVGANLQFIFYLTANTGAARTGHITLTQAESGNTVRWSITQAGKEEAPTITGYGEWEISVSADPTNISSEGGTSTITATCKRDVNWSDGDTTTEYSEDNITLSTDLGSLSSTSVSSNSGTSTLTLSANTDTDNKTATITVTCKNISDTCTVTILSTNGATITGYGDWKVELTPEKTIAMRGDAVKIHGTCARTVNWSDGTTTTEYSKNNITLSGVAESGNYVSGIESISSDGKTNAKVIVTGTTNVEDTLTITGTCENTTDICYIYYYEPSGKFSDIEGYDTNNSAYLTFRHGDSFIIVNEVESNYGEVSVTNGVVTWSCDDINISGSDSKYVLIKGSNGDLSYSWDFKQKPIDWKSDATNTTSISASGGTATISKITMYYIKGTNKIYGTYTGLITVPVGTLSKSSVTTSQSGDTFTWTIPANTTGSAINHLYNIYFPDINMYLYGAINLPAS